MLRLAAWALIAGVVFVLILPIIPGCGHEITRIHSLAFSPDGQRLAVARLDGVDINIDLHWLLVGPERTVCVVDVPSATVTKVVAHDSRPNFKGLGWEYTRLGSGSLAFAADGRSLFVLEFGGGAIERFDLDSGHEATFFDPGGGKKIGGFSLSRDRKVVAAAATRADEGAWLLDAETAAPILTNPRTMESTLRRSRRRFVIGQSLACSLRLGRAIVRRNAPT